MNYNYNISLLDLKKNSQFICPNCGRIHNISDAFVRAVLVSEESDMEFRGNHYVDHISESFLKVRFCPKCKNVRTRNKIFRHIGYFTIGPLILLSLFSLFNWRLMFSWGGYFLGMCLLFMFYVPAVKIFREALSPILNKKIIERAHKGNAIC